MLITQTTGGFMFLIWYLWLAVVPRTVLGNPNSVPYIPFRTSPFDQPKVHHELEWSKDETRSKIQHYDPMTSTENDQCPLQFSLGISRRVHHTPAKGLGIVSAPVIFPILPSQGPGRQVLYTTQYEHLDLLTPSKSQLHPDIKEGLIQHVEFPLLFESSSFLTSPVLGDVNGDGIVDAVLTDYDGGIYAIGLQVNEGRRYFHKAQVPRLYLRRQWMESKVNETLGINPHETGEDKKEDQTDDAPSDRTWSEKTHDPYHSYFEYTYGSSVEHEEILRGITANVLGQDEQHAKSLQERRKRKITPDFEKEMEGTPEVEEEAYQADPNHRRLQEVQNEDANEIPLEEGRKAETEQVEDMTIGETHENEESTGEESYDDPWKEEENSQFGFSGDDYYGDGGTANPYGGDDSLRYGDDDYPRYDDYSRHDDNYPRYDDYYGRYDSERDDYYDDKHYVRIPPHILCTPVLAEFPKLYNEKAETEQLLFVAVSYYLDEDEYEGLFSYRRFKETDHGDETEVQRGMYVANAIMVYQFGESPRWGRQEHLDLSGDHSAPVNTTLVGSIPLMKDTTGMGAFALSSPTVADIDGDGTMEVLFGTSMGFVYGMDARNLFTKDKWPVQFQHGIESRILVEDVLGDTNLEIFVADVGGNVVCLDHEANKLWHRNLAESVGEKTGDSAIVSASSPMVLGDVDGDGTLDLVVVMKFKLPGSLNAQYLFALSADTGKDLQNFPVRIWGVSSLNTKLFHTEDDEPVHQKLPAPLLVDLHTDQSFLQDYLLRNGTTWTKPPRFPTKAPPHGGNSHGLHIVQPYESSLVIMEAGSGCFQTIVIGDEILTMVQADDVHGTNNLDLVISTASGNIVTLETAAPYHPLSVWNNGEVRGRTNTFAHGYSASQGIFVHEVSRQFRDIFGVYVPVTFEIFDNRPNIQNEPDKRVYKVEIREGTSRPVFRKTYQSAGKYTERMYIPYGPGYYALTLVMKSTHGLVYEDTFHLGYNVNYMEGFGFLLWLPLVLSSVFIFLFGTKKTHWEDDDYEGDSRDGRQGILGGRLPE